MTTLAYFDCPTGLAGDMCLGALVDAGVPLDYLTEQLGRLGVAHEYHLWAEPLYHNGLRATKVHVDLHQASPATSPESDGESVSDTGHAHGHAAGTRHLPEIEQLIQKAGLPERAEQWSLAVFRNLAQAEALAHGIAPEEVHFHEVGATDAIVDIVGTCLGLDWLGIDVVYCSAMPVGGGTIWAAHGRLPVPVPAVLKLWEMRQVPVFSNGIERELVTPTGAAIATTLAQGFGGVPAMTIRKVGLGAGSRQLPIANVFRLWIGEDASSNSQVASRSKSTQTVTHGSAHTHGHAHAHAHSHAEAHHYAPDHSSGVPHTHNSHPPSLALDAALPVNGSNGSQATQDTVVVLQTQVDDLNPQVVGYLYDQLFAVGALDVFTTAIAMKKSRPGLLLTVICPPDRVLDCEAVLFRETTTLGIRRQTCDRTILSREIQTVETSYGPVRVKVARHPANGTILNVYPEYDDCAEHARAAQVPWHRVHQQTLFEWSRTHDSA